MKTPEQTIVQTGDLGGQKIAMGISQDAFAHIMNVLTDLYSDPLGAVLREYSTNALDSHIEAGNTDPIEVYLPSPFSPFLRIVDHGVGLSVDDITRIYSQYGASTKRDSDDVVGMLGLGAKSALTLVPQFNLTSVKDGVKIVVSVSRSGDGTGQMEIVDTKATTESNGVEISIPLTPSSAVRQKAQDFFRFWEEGTVLVDGHAPARLDGSKVGDKFLVNHALNHDYVVMGNVAYQTKEPIYGSGWHAKGIVAFVNIGDVHFTPSREALQYTPKTKATLDSLRGEFEKELRSSAQAEIDALANHTEAWTEARAWQTKFGLKDLTYKGLTLPAGDVETNKFRTHSVYPGRNYGGNRWAVQPSDSKRLYVVGFTGNECKMSPVQRKKVEIYCQNNGLNFHEVGACRDDTLWKDPKDKVFFAGFTIIKWEKINVIKVPRVHSATGQVRTEPYDMYIDGYTTKEVGTLDTTKPIVYYSPAELKSPTWLGKVLLDTQIIILNKNRWDKFKRDWPMAKHYRQAVKDTVAGLPDKTTWEDRVRHHWDRSYAYRLPTTLDWSKVEDRELAKFAKVVNDNNFKYSDAANSIRNLRSMDVYPMPTIPSVENPLTKYPLGDRIRNVPAEHALWYLNSYYNEFLKEN